MLLVLQLPGANAGKPDVGAAAKDAAKKTPFGFMNMGDLAFDLPGSNVSKDDLPNNVKPSEAKGLPKGPTAKPPSGPSLPKVWIDCLLHSSVPWFACFEVPAHTSMHLTRTHPEPGVVSLRILATVVVPLLSVSLETNCA